MRPIIVTVPPMERAAFLVTLGRIQEAIRDYHKALKYSPNAPSLHFNYGIVLAGMSDRVQALAHLNRAVELSPENADFRYFLGSYLFNLQEYQLAVQHLTEAVKLKPDNALAQTRLQEATAALKPDSNDVYRKK